MGNRVTIIAEAGVNHNGSLEKAKELVKLASNAGADYVKFQTFRADKLVSKVAVTASYQNINLNQEVGTQIEMLKKLEMPMEWHFVLKEFAIENGIKFLSTGFDEESIDFLDNLGIDFFKIPSGELTNKPYLKHIASKNKPIVISTGMANLNEINDAIAVLKMNGIRDTDITVLHCNTEYPTPMSHVNLRAMLHIEKELGLKVGYSDHTLGIEVPIAAVALGATVIEKHFTLDKSLEGPDHKASLDFNELNDMIKAIRNIELALIGSGIKEPSISEFKNINIVRKSIHLNKPVKAGHIIKEDDLIMKRPGDGISPMRIENVIGQMINKDLMNEHKLDFKDFAN